ncbi:MAG: glycoside hydrolase family 88 protein [Opitutaceae bacterium]|jgi:unsaturated rhamnogalacturonyl hydrolase|nr:glycoside hydrolase family 88 protein [Opitutaceae bacterium]
MNPTTTAADLEKTIARVIARMTTLSAGRGREKCPIDIVAFDCWEWPQGVGLYGLCKYHEQTRDPATLALLRGWFARRLAAGAPARNVNTTAPMLALAHLAEAGHGGGDAPALCADWAEWVFSKMTRTADGGIQHAVTGLANDGQLWADTLYMTVLFLAKAGRLLRRDDYLEEAARQFLVHIKYLFDRETGLWFHGWDFNGRHNFARARWARGNCWFTAGVVDFLEIARPSAAVRGFLVDTLRAQVDALARLQAADGLWHTLLDDPASYAETSASAGFGYGILAGARLGYLDPAAAAVGRRALDGVLGKILPDGTVTGVSFGTPMGRTLDFYRDIPCRPMPYGQSLAVLLLGEALKHEKIKN